MEKNITKDEVLVAVNKIQQGIDVLKQYINMGESFINTIHNDVMQERDKKFIEFLAKHASARLYRVISNIKQKEENFIVLGLTGRDLMYYREIGKKSIEEFFALQETFLARSKE